MRDQGFYLKKHGEGGEMDRSEYYRQEGYQQGFMDAKRTGGKIKQENIDKYLNTEKKFIHNSLKGIHKGLV